MNILFTSYYFPPDSRGGAEISAYNIGRELVKQGNEIHVLTRASEEEHDDVFITHDVLPRRELPRERIEAATRGHVARIVDEHDIDVVHAQNAYTAIGAARACDDTKAGCAVSLRDYWLLDPLRICYDFVPGEFSTDTGLAHLLRRAWKKFSYDGAVKHWLSPCILLYLERRRRHALKHIDKADVLVANSGFMREHHDDIHPNVRTVYNGIDTELFQPLHTEEQEDTHILFIGRMTPEKGVGTLVDALASIHEERDDIVLDVVGRETLPPWLRGRMQDAGIADAVMCHGRLPFDKLPWMYSAADIVAFPSEWQEPFGRISIEAMACGTPVVATDVGGIPEVIDDGETGVLVNPGDADALAEELMALADDPDRHGRLADAGRDHVEERFSPETVATEQLQVYEGIT